MEAKLTKEEVLITQMALNTLIEDMEETSKDVTMPWSPDARQAQREMLAAAKGALKKIALASGHEVKLAPYKEGDEKGLLTKES